MYTLDEAFRARAAERVAGFPRQGSGADGLRHAAVAATIVDDDAGRACFLLTRRAPRLRSHGGQWALPGGRIDEGETPEQAALRELAEEVGLHLGPQAVLGPLDDYETRSGFRITPVVVWGGRAEHLTPNPAEVAHIYRVPLEEIDAEDAVRFVSIPESDRPVIQLRLFDRHVHAPTAAVLYQLREVVLHGRHTRVAHLEQPVFAWR